MITIWEHIGLFVLLSFLVSLDYNGLRQDDLKTIVKLAIKRFFIFMGASTLFGAALYFLAVAL